VFLSPGEAQRGDGTPRAAASPSRDLGAAVRAALERDAAAAYAVSASSGVEATDGAGSAPVLHAPNPAQGIDAFFTTEGVRVAPRAGADWRLEIRVAGFGAEGAVEPVAAAAPSVGGRRVEYRRGDLVEWYENGPRGIEQGFTLNAPPAGTERGLPVRVEMAVRSDLEPALDAEGRAVSWAAPGAADPALRYDGLIAFDAGGRRLPRGWSWIAGASPSSSTRPAPRIP